MTHPAFVSAASKEASERWLRDFIKQAVCPDYDTVIAAAMEKYVDEIDGYGLAYELGEDCLHFNGRAAYGVIPPEFWDHVEIVIGKKCSCRPTSFSCSC